MGSSEVFIGDPRWLGDAESITDDGGRFEIREPMPRTGWVVVFKNEGYKSVTRNLDFGAMANPRRMIVLLAEESSQEESRIFVELHPSKNVLK